MYLATQVQCPDTMIVESTFTSVKDVVASWTHPKMATLMSYRFDSLERISNLQCPFYMIHGTHDRIVPYTLGKQLVEASLNGRELLAVNRAGHNDLQQTAGEVYQQTIARWLNS
jgi:hypothetical protein